MIESNDFYSCILEVGIYFTLKKKLRYVTYEYFSSKDTNEWHYVFDTFTLFKKKTITTIFLHLRNKIFENMTHQYPDVCEIFNLFALSEAW